MGKAKIFIEMALEEKSCNIISPQAEYQRDEGGCIGGSIPRSDELYNTLQQTISQKMQEKYNKFLTENLGSRTPIIYTDYRQDKNKHPLIDILQNLTTQTDPVIAHNNIGKALYRQSIVQEQGYWKPYAYTTDTIPTYSLLDMYQQEYTKQTEKKGDDYIEMLQGLEYQRIAEAIGNIIKAQGRRSAFVYMDNVGSLTTQQQSLINNILYTRGSIARDVYLRCKINNGDKVRKTRKTNTGQRVQSTHDYSETTVKKEYL